ncbi:MAG: cobalamin B12-binding domain-containing protein, partial [Planctomycetota bacterium]
GWDVCLLGANTPEEALVDAVRTHQPDLLALSVISSLNVRAVGETIDRLKADPECSGVPILVGGPPFRLAPELWREIGADACAGSATESVAVGNELVTRPTSGV